MYLTTDVRPFKLLSMHTLMNFLVALQIGTLLAFSWLATTADFANVTASLVRALVVAALTSSALFGLSALYLVQRGKYHPDKAVHWRKEPTA